VTEIRSGARDPRRRMRHHARLARGTVEAAESGVRTNQARVCALGGYHMVRESPRRLPTSSEQRDTEWSVTTGGTPPAGNAQRAISIHAAVQRHFSTDNSSGKAETVQFAGVHGTEPAGAFASVSGERNCSYISRTSLTLAGRSKVSI
jgi:hypothetical protein